MAAVAPRERSKFCEHGCLSECCRVEAAWCQISQISVYLKKQAKQENVLSFV